MVGQAGLLDDSQMVFRWDNIHIRIIQIGVKNGLFPISLRYFVPKLPGAFFAPITHMEGDNLPRFNV